MGAAIHNISDLPGIMNQVQTTMIRYPKDVIANTIKEYFSQDSYYHYVKDEWGFNKTPDHTPLAQDAGIRDNSTTRIFIGESFRFDVQYLPAVIIRSGGTKNVPISLNREQGRIDYATATFVDGYGNRVNIQVPDHYVLAGAWEGSINIDILSRGIREADEISELISMMFTDWDWNNLYRIGISVRNVNVSSPSEMDDVNTKIHKRTVTLDIRGEWRREIPVNHLIETIRICVDIGNIEQEPPVIAPNLQINTYVEYVDDLLKL